MLTKLAHQATQLITQSIASAETMGANLLITRGEEELLYAQAGFADWEKQKPIERDTIFRLYSMTKPITAAAAMILLERGQLDLYQPLSDVIPAFAGQKVNREGQVYEPQRPVLMHDLLSMTSGLVYPGEQTVAGTAMAEVFEDACARLESKRKNSYLYDTWKSFCGAAACNGKLDRSGRLYLCQFYAQMCGSGIAQRHMCKRRVWLGRLAGRIFCKSA